MYMLGRFGNDVEDKDKDTCWEFPHKNWIASKKGKRNFKKKFNMEIKTSGTVETITYSKAPSCCETKKSQFCGIVQHWQCVSHAYDYTLVNQITRKEKQPNFKPCDRDRERGRYLFCDFFAYRYEGSFLKTQFTKQLNKKKRFYVLWVI